LTTSTLQKPLQNHQECHETQAQKVTFLPGQIACENDKLTTGFSPFETLLPRQNTCEKTLFPSLLDEMLLSPQTTEHSDFGSFLDSVALTPTDLFFSPTLGTNALDDLFQHPFEMERSMSTYSASTLASPFAAQPDPALGLSPVISEQSQYLSEQTLGVKPQQILPPARKRGRKRKELELDHQELIAEIEDKRRRNTESARRNRIRRKNELQDLQEENATLTKENAKLRQMLTSLGVQIPL
jgi:hypothetical protein